MSRSSSKPRVSCASKTAGDGPTGTEAAQLSTAPRAHLTVAERAARGRAMRSEVDAARTPPAGSRPPITRPGRTARAAGVGQGGRAGADARLSADENLPTVTLRRGLAGFGERR
jgi:hypothetical protein